MEGLHSGDKMSVTFSYLPVAKMYLNLPTP